jgi:hypothetical protein
MDPCDVIGVQSEQLKSAKLRTLQSTYCETNSDKQKVETTLSAHECNYK